MLSDTSWHLCIDGWISLLSCIEHLRAPARPSLGQPKAPGTACPNNTEFYEQGLSRDRQVVVYPKGTRSLTIWGWDYNGTSFSVAIFFAWSKQDMFDSNTWQKLNLHCILSSTGGRLQLIFRPLQLNRLIRVCSGYSYGLVLVCL